MQLTWSLQLELAGRCSMNRAGFRGCKARSYIPGAHRARRNVGPDIPVLENGDESMLSKKSILLSWDLPRSAKTNEVRKLDAFPGHRYMSSQRVPKWNPEAERVK